jgi:hypothetical protein
MSKPTKQTKFIDPILTAIRKGGIVIGEYDMTGIELWTARVRMLSKAIIDKEVSTVEIWKLIRKIVKTPYDTSFVGTKNNLKDHLAKKISQLPATNIASVQIKKAINSKLQSSIISGPNDAYESILDLFQDHILMDSIIFLRMITTDQAMFNGYVKTYLRGHSSFSKYNKFVTLPAAASDDSDIIAAMDNLSISLYATKSTEPVTGPPPKVKGAKAAAKAAKAAKVEPAATAKEEAAAAAKATATTTEVDLWDFLMNATLEEMLAVLSVNAENDVDICLKFDASIGSEKESIPSLYITRVDTSETMMVFFDNINNSIYDNNGKIIAYVEYDEDENGEKRPARIMDQNTHKCIALVKD